jgi:hypothetical protein
MKKALYIILFISLFSYLYGVYIKCSRGYKLVCKDYDVDTCECVRNASTGKWVYEKSCDGLKWPTCNGMGAYVNCICVS